jgi:exonuclease VII large subunit|tara:strand:- start:737 stop:1138 length:402 start_codon:yes stop_codon:yes gene_type:complete
MEDLQVEVELLKKEVADMKQIHVRLDTAIGKISDVSNCINRMLAVHEEKITQQEDLQTRSIQEFNTDVKELHGRITDTQKELTALMTEQHQSQTQALVKLKEDISSLDKWRYMIIGGAIVVGFIIQSATKYLT